MIDIHCHIIPCIDDGPESQEMAGKMLAAANKDGITTIFASSHYFPGYEEAYGTLFKRIRDIAVEYGITLLPSCEHDLSFLSGNNKIFPSGNGRFILVDICSPYIPDYVEELVFDYELKGFKLIFVHPERLFGLKDLPKLAKLAEQGALFQLNAASLTGRNGGFARKMSVRLIENGIAHYIASDAHSPRQRGFYMTDARRYIGEKFGNDIARILFEINPERMVEGEYPQPVPAQKISLLQKIIRLIAG